MKNLYKIRLIISFIVFLLIIIAFSGLFYPVKFLNFQFTPLIQRLVFDFSVTALAGLIILLLVTFFFGRFYCSMFCPFGILQEIEALFIKKSGHKIKAYNKNLIYKYFISLVSFVMLFSGSSLLIRCIEPYTIFGKTMTGNTEGIIFSVVVFVLVFFKNRFFCTNICPAGALLGLCSRFSVNKIYVDTERCISCKMCEKNCPSGCIDIDKKVVDNEICIRCLKCISDCPKSAIKYGRRKYMEERKISLGRRKFIWTLSVLAFCSSAYASGVKLSKEVAHKFKNVILPAGSQDANKMANSCLNCNLCVRNCPHGILSKADNNFPAVHINMEQGKGYCGYNCNKCSQICPSGAIKKISLQEKQHTRIGMASISSDCVGCSHCIRICPVGAISMKDNKAVLDGSKCIGCGKCKSVCPVGAIKVYGVNKQTKV